MMPAGEMFSQGWAEFALLFQQNRDLLLPFGASVVGAGFGAWFGARAAVGSREKAREDDIQTTVNVAIASMVALLGKLLNFKRELVAPAGAVAEELDDTLKHPNKAFGEDGEKGKVAVRLEIWPETPFALRLPNDRIYEYAGRELDVIQLLKMLDYTLADLSHLVKQRNDLIRQMNAHQAAKGALPMDGLKLYLRYADEISRHVDENLFFLDRGIEKARHLAFGLLPKRRHSAIAEIGLKPESESLMPSKELIKGWVK